MTELTSGFTPNEDGSLTVYLQHESPGPEREANWLPASDGPFALAQRILRPEQDVLDGTCRPSAIRRVS